MTRNEKKQGEIVEHWMVTRAREVLKAIGKLTDFQVSDISVDDLREVVGNAEHSRRMREADFSITREGSAHSSGAGHSPIWDEVMKW